MLVGLLDPLEVKGLTLKNRIVMPPMQTSLATTEGAATDNLIEHYVRRSKALGLLIVEHSYVSPDGRLSERQLGIHDDDLVPGLEKLSRGVHATGHSSCDTDQSCGKKHQHGNHEDETCCSFTQRKR